MTNTVLVTGATGCLGRHLVDSLTADGTRVRALVRPSSDTRHLEQRGAEILRGSLLHDYDLHQAVRGVDAVYHLGGLVIDDRPDDTSDALWLQIRDTNVDGTQRLAFAAARAGARRFVFCSSVRIFGFGNQMRWHEDDPRTPSDLYSRGKSLAEHGLLRIGRDTGLEVVNIRPRFIYGNHDRYVMPKLVKQVCRGWVPLVGGDAICDLVYVEDCVHALRLAAERPVAGQSFNITSGECLSLRDILQQVAQALHQPIRFVPLPGPAVFVLASAIEVGARVAGRRPPLSRAQLRWYLNDHHFSIAKARRQLGYAPRFRLPDALMRMDLQQFAAYGG
ncbi:MAG: NAD-dependent epimerase/dehydratase family protein [Chloroflexi bacterium]|nr:NAD-dependent epimerase/dehydratase family protein [Chloroflexota bacterium]